MGGSSLSHQQELAGLEGEFFWERGDRIKRTREDFVLADCFRVENRLNEYDLLEVTLGALLRKQSRLK